MNLEYTNCIIWFCYFMQIIHSHVYGSLCFKARERQIRKHCQDA